MYFIDKDIDDFIGVDIPEANDIYCTTHYSIENYISTQDMLEMIWTDLFKLPDEDRRKVIALQGFSEEYRRFTMHMRTLMAWIIKRRRAGEYIKIRDLSLDDHYFLNGDMKFCKRISCLKKIRVRCARGVLDVEWSDVRSVCNELSGIDPKTYIRGKFELWFFVKFSTRLEEELRKSCDKKMRPKNKISLSISNALDILSARCPVSGCLQTFLKCNLN